MPIPLITLGISEGFSAIPYAYTATKLAAVAAVIAALKYYFGGARNPAERVMHSKVVMVTVSFPPCFPFLFPRILPQLRGV